MFYVKIPSAVSSIRLGSRGLISRALARERDYLAM